MLHVQSSSISNTKRKASRLLLHCQYNHLFSYAYKEGISELKAQVCLEWTRLPLSCRDNWILKTEKRQMRGSFNTCSVM